jgi:ArsR family transcriptional regulator, lead/cadmium/zinc/bismuth-responsive transcriptional repressor
MVDCSEPCELQTVDLLRVAAGRAQLISAETANDLAETFTALADPTRARLISALKGAELCVGELADLLQMTVSAISHQLNLLRHLRIVRSRREGRFIYYALDDEHIATIYQCGLEHIRHS